MLKRPAHLGMAVGLAALLWACEPATSPGRLREAPLPRGVLESPAPGTLVTHELIISGWAFASEGVDDVAVYANGNYVDSAVLGFARPDIIAADPSNGAAGLTGFRLRLDAFRLPPGGVTVVVQVRSRAGATRDIGTVAVEVSRAG